MIIVSFSPFSLSWADFGLELYMFGHTMEYFWTLVQGQYDSFGPVLTYTTNNGFNILNGFIYVSGLISTLIALERYVHYSFMREKST